MVTRVSILGATGSIGRSAIDVLSRMQDEWCIVGLDAGSQAVALAEQANLFRPEALAMTDAEAAASCAHALEYSPRVLAGEEAICELVESVECDCVVCAVVGAAGLRATMAAVRLGRRVALATKEARGCAGSLLMPLAGEAFRR